eukprot:TRINITY_DN4133_c0_g1_i6.p1 TRINITY_DN4133_c0_g1~~TRINITY_DN4133_c0_g1_i6.p1  ORF type:complete len:202 (+),score=23.70 TRINITY_DN4133_c0_g1_i6:148-753(+)
MTETDSESVEELKCVIIGDNGCGKSSFLYTFLNGSFPTEQLKPKLKEVTQTVCDYSVLFIDTRSSVTEDRNRLLAYPFCDLVLVCYDLTSKASIQEITEKWVGEISHHCPTKPVTFLVGLKSDGKLEVTDEDIQAIMAQNATILRSYQLSSQQNSAKVQEAVNEMLTLTGEAKKKRIKQELAEARANAARVANKRRGCYIL